MGTLPRVCPNCGSKMSKKGRMEHHEREVLRLELKTLLDQIDAGEVDVLEVGERLDSLLESIERVD